MFITFEGPDGCGKTTQLTLLSEFLAQQGYAVYSTREPGGTLIGDRIRALLHDPDHTEMDYRAEILLYSASRAQHVYQVIRPRLEAGDIVLCDRFYDSTFAYQGHGRLLNLDTLRQITEFATGGLRPDLTLYFDIEPEMGLMRRQRDSGAEWNRLDAETLEFHQRVYEGYHKLIADDSDRWVVIDANQPVNAIQKGVQGSVLSRLEQHTS